MDLSTSIYKLTATLLMPSAFHPLDAIAFTHRRLTILGRRDKTIASFSFPRHGWQASGEEWTINASAKSAILHLHKLAKKAACSKVTACGEAYGATVFEVTTPLSNFLAAFLSECKGGCSSTLRLKLMPIRLSIPTPEDAEEPFSNLQFSLFCNERQCGAMDLIMFSNQLLAVMKEESSPTEEETAT